MCQPLVLCFAGLLGLNLEIGYYLHLLKGQARLLWKGKPIAQLLKRTDLDPATRTGLELVQELREFAVQEIGLTASRNYTSFCDIGDGPVSWQLTAAPKDRLEPLRWRYPVVGEFPYRGFFDLKRGLAEKSRLENKGFDTHLGRVGAYSTLGWFDDPVLSTMLRYREEDLAELLFHELVHGTIWIPDQVSFNESLATFVGEKGAFRFLERKYGPSKVEEARKVRKDRLTFKTFMHDVAERLKTVFDSDLSYEEKLGKKSEIFEDAKERFAELNLQTEIYKSFPRWKLNNALMLSYRTYHEKIDIFERVYDLTEGDLQRTIEILRGCEREQNPVEYLEALLSETKK